MKKFTYTFLIVVFCATSILFPFVSFNSITMKVHADTKYLRVINENTVFYLNANESSPLFYLPYTYYVKPIGISGEFTHVEWCGAGGVALDGYVKTAELFNDNLDVSNPYLSLNITTCTTAVLYSDAAAVTPIQYIFPERAMRYYGNYSTNGINVFYVEYNGKLGYVKETEVHPFLVANHPNELTFIPKEPEQTPDNDTPEIQSPENDLLSLKIIIVICLLFAGIVALFIALKQKPNQKSNAGYYDENEYE